MVADINREGAELVVRDIAHTGVQSVAITVDVTGRHSIDEMVVEALRAFGKIDIFVNDAGVVGSSNCVWM